MKNSKETKAPVLNQNEMVIKFLRTNSRRKLTSEQIASSINNLFSLKGKKALTTIQVSKCLNRFSERNMVNKVDFNGVLSSGRKTSRWTYVKP